MAEYASITAALAILASSLSGVVGSIRALPSTDGQASTLVVTAARSYHLSAAEARAAYAKAPYQRPVLRYLYSLGWIGAASDKKACTAALFLGPRPSDAATQVFRRTPKLLARLRAAHVTVSQAATALGSGTTDGCA